MAPETTIDKRKAALETWLAGIFGAAPRRIAPASADASFRRYFRVWHDGQTFIAMDAPPDREDLGPYIQVAEILAATGVNVPRVLGRHPGQGFLLLTDLASVPRCPQGRRRPGRPVRGRHSRTVAHAIARAGGSRPAGAL
jgi:aminoglycoside/choline kinase family phosphotransferase